MVFSINSVETIRCTHTKKKSLETQLHLSPKLTEMEDRLKYKMQNYKTSERNI